MLAIDLPVNVATMKRMQDIKLKVFMLDIKDEPIQITKEEQELLAYGKRKIDEMGVSAVLQKLNVPEHLLISEQVKNCCLQALYTGLQSSKLDKDFKLKLRSDSSDIVDCIISAHYAYLKLLKRIRKKIITVDEPVAYNSKI